MTRVALVLALLLSFPALAQERVIIPRGDNSITPGFSGTFTGTPTFSGSIALTGGVTGLPTINGWSLQWGAREDSAAATPTAAGSGYAAGDTITIAATGGSCVTVPTLAVISVSGNGVAKWMVQKSGSCTSVPTNPVTQASTSGSGTGATFTLNWGPIPSTPVFSPLAIDTNENVRLGTNAAPSLTTGNELTAVGFAACGGVTTGNENTCLGWKAGGSMNTSFNVFVGGAGVALASTATGAGNTIVGDVALRNITDAQAVTLVGNNVAKNGSVNKAWGWTGVGSSAFLNLDNSNSSNDSTAFGINACKGGTGTAAFRQVACIGGDTGGALTSGNHITILGTGVGNTTVTSGTNIVLIGTDGNTDSNTSSSIHVGAGAGDIWSATGADTPSTSATTIAGTLAVSGITTDAAHTDATVCEDTTTHVLYAGSGAAGICLGTSSARFKTDIRPDDPDYMGIMALKPVAYRHRPGFLDGGAKVNHFFLAEDVYHVFPDLVGLDAEGRPNNVDYVGLQSKMVALMQQQQKQIEHIEHRMSR